MPALSTPGTVLQTRWLRLLVVAAGDDYVDVEFADQPRALPRRRPLRIARSTFDAYAAEAR